MTAIATARTPWMSFPVPDGWHVDPDDAGLVLRRDAERDDGHAVVTASAEDTALPLAEEAAARVRRALDGSVGTFVIACDAGTAGGRPTRRILFTRPVDAERDEAVDEVLWSVGRGVERLSARCAVPDLPAVSAALTEMAAGAVFTPPATDDGAAADGAVPAGADAAPGAVPAAPATVSDATGVPGDADPLRFVGPRQRFAADGPVLPASAVRLLARTRKRLARDRRDAADAAALHDVGLVDADGALTPAGVAVRSHWRRSKPLVEVRTRGGASGLLTAWLGTDDTVLIGTTPSAGSQPGGHDDMRLGVFTLDRALPAILSWLGVRPTSPVGADAALPAAVYAARVVDASTPPPDGVSDGLGRAWRHVWTEHRLQSPQAEIVIVDAADAGFLRVAVRDGTAHIRPVSSRDVFDAVVGVYGTAVADAA